MKYRLNVQPDDKDDLEEIGENMRLRKQRNVLGPWDTTQEKEGV